MTEAKKANLFELDQAELDLLNKLEAVFAEPMDELSDPGLTCEQIVDAHLASLADVQEQLADKLQGYVKAIRAKQFRAEMLVTEAALYQAEVQRLKLRASQEADTASFLESRLKAFLERRGLKEMEIGTFKVKIVNQGGKLPLVLSSAINAELVAERFQTIIPERIDFNKEEIEAALKSGEKLAITLPGVAGGVPQEVVWAQHGERKTKLKIA